MVNSNPSLLRRAVHYLLPYTLPRWRIVRVAAVALLAGAGFELLKPWPLKFVFDYLLMEPASLPAWAIPIVGDSRNWLLLAVCASILLLAGLSGLAAYFHEYHLKRLGEEVAFDLRVGLFGHIQRLSLAFHDSRKTGDMITRVTGDTAAVKELMSSSLLQITTALLTLVGMLAIIVYMDWQLAIVGLVTVPLLWPVVFWFRRRIEHAARNLRSREVEVTSVTQETMSSIRMVKAFGREDYQQQQLCLESSKRVRAGLVAAKLEARYVLAVDIIGARGPGG